MNPTNEQIEIVEAAKTGANLAISAFAGAGKTSTLKLVAEVLPKRSLYIAFNKAIAEEAKTKFPSNVECRTLHSIAYENIIGNSRKLKEKLKSSLDSREILKFLGLELEHLVYKDRLREVRRLRKAIELFCQSAEKDIYSIAFSSYKSALVKELTIKLGYSEIDWEFVEEKSTKYAAIAVKLWEGLIAEDSLLSINHDIYLKLYHLGPRSLHNVFRVIYLDEAQDSNDLTLDIVMTCAAKGSQIILVGDTYQAIYAWRGAVNAFDKIPENFVRKSLTTSFRFHSGIAETANELLNFMGSKEDVIGAAKFNSNFNQTDKAILCRTNAGILNAVLAAAARGEKIYCTKDFSSFFSAIWHTIFLKQGKEIKYPYPAFSDYETWDMFTKAAAELDDEAAQCINFIYWCLEQEIYPGDLINKAKSAISDKLEPGMTTITTMHKSKGLEWDVVEIVNDFAIERAGETYEEMISRVRGSFEETQLGNLLYVAVTRAKQKLILNSIVEDVIRGVS
jgi:superfamily I DNA/RNA helicase